MDDVIGSPSIDFILGPKPAEHLIHCERCRRLIGVMEKAGDGSSPSEILLSRIRRRILQDLKPIRPLAPFGAILFGCMSIFLTVVAVGGQRLGLNGWDALSVMQRFAMFLTLASAAILFAVSMIRQMVPGSNHTFAPAFISVSIPVVLMMLIFLLFGSQPESVFFAGGVNCMRNGIAYSIPAAFIFWLILRRGAILCPRLTGSLTGGLAGLAGLSVLEVSCPNLDIAHILVWHGGVLAISSLGGILVGAGAEYVAQGRVRRNFTTPFLRILK